METQTQPQGWESTAKQYFERWEDKELVQLVTKTIEHLVQNEEGKTYLSTAKNIVRFYNQKGYITAKQKWALSIFASQSE